MTTLKRGDRWVMRTGMALIIAVASAIATLWITGWTLFKPYVPPTPRSVLTEQLSGPWDQVSKEFDRRVKAAFPIGTAESAMTLALRRQGFERQDWTFRKTGNDEAQAFRSENNWVCNQGAFVYWRSDEAGNIASIRGEYRELGCL